MYKFDPDLNGYSVQSVLKQIQQTLLTYAKIYSNVNKKISLINRFILNLYFSEDLMKMDELVDDSIRQSSIDIDKSSSVLKVGCLLACLFQKKEMVIFRKTILIILNILKI